MSAAASSAGWLTDPTALGSREVVALLGLGTALVYPTLIAAISDAVSPVARAPVVGVYRFWRDMGYAIGALVAGAAADAIGYGGAIVLVAGMTAGSGLWVLIDMPDSSTRAHSIDQRSSAPGIGSGRPLEPGGNR